MSQPFTIGATTALAPGDKLQSGDFMRADETLPWEEVAEEMAGHTIAKEGAGLYRRPNPEEAHDQA